jgi:outer membrane protein assembly factor BamB
VAVLDGKIYIAGGLTPSGDSRTVYAFDPDASTVRRVATLPEPEAHAALAPLGGRLYLVGWRSVLRIDPASGRVSRAATLKQTLTDPNAVTVGDRIVILGGGTNSVFKLAD